MTIRAGRRGSELAVNGTGRLFPRESLRARDDVNRLPADPEGIDRYSLGFFVAPGADTEVRPIDGGAAAPALNAGRDLAAFIAQFDGGPPKY